ncbi:hypothetical protein PAMA_012129 [Pampus argenteus]
MSLFYAVALLAFTAGWCPCVADVGDFTSCLQFFYRSWPPKGLAGTPICQHYYNQYRFATLYSHWRRSPWFSAYKYTVPKGKRPTACWKFEPQPAHHYGPPRLADVAPTERPQQQYRLPRLADVAPTERPQQQYRLPRLADVAPTERPQQYRQPPARPPCQDCIYFQHCLTSANRNITDWSGWFQTVKPTLDRALDSAYMTITKKEYTEQIRKRDTEISTLVTNQKRWDMVVRELEEKLRQRDSEIYELKQSLRTKSEQAKGMGRVCKADSDSLIAAQEEEKAAFMVSSQLIEETLHAKLQIEEERQTNMTQLEEQRDLEISNLKEGLQNKSKETDEMEFVCKEKCESQKNTKELEEQLSQRDPKEDLSKKDSVMSKIEKTLQIKSKEAEKMAHLWKEHCNSSQVEQEMLQTKLQIHEESQTKMKALEKQLSQRDSEISDLKKSLHMKCKKAKTIIVTLKEEKAALLASSQLNQETLQAKLQILEERLTNMTLLEEQLSQRDSEISDLKKSLQMKSEEADEMERVCREKCDSLTATWEEEKAALLASTQLKQETLQAKLQFQDENLTNMKQLEDHLIQRDLEISDLKKSLQNKSEEADEMERMSKEKCDSLTATWEEEKAALLASTQLKQETLQAKLQIQDESLKNVNELEEQLSQRESEISELKKSLQNKSEEAAEMERMSKEKCDSLTATWEEEKAALLASTQLKQETLQAKIQIQDESLKNMNKLEKQLICRDSEISDLKKKNEEANEMERVLRQRYSLMTEICDEEKAVLLNIHQQKREELEEQLNRRNAEILELRETVSRIISRETELLESWKAKIEELAYPEADGNMIPFPPGPLDQNVVDSQAVELDYINSTYSRGHLNPSLHHQTREDRSSTFTLTNVVPQKAGSNDGPWEFLEQAVNVTLADYCLGEAYIVTGIIPYQKDEHWLKNHRVAVPEYMWSAYCCPNYSNNLPEELKDAFPTYAAIGRNDRNSTEEIVPVCQTAKKQFRGYDVRQMPLATLEMYLRDRFNTIVSVFYEQCSGSA